MNTIRYTCFIFLFLTLGISSITLAQQEKLDLLSEYNRPLINRLKFLEKIPSSNNEVRMAVIGDYVDTNQLNRYLHQNIFEIPNDGIDNDHNGLIDDYYGFDVISLSGKLEAPKFSEHENHIISLLHSIQSRYRITQQIKLIPIGVFGNTNEFDANFLLKIAQAIRYAIDKKKVKVVSISYGYSEFNKHIFQFVNSDKDQSWAYLQETMDYAYKNGVVVFASGTNDPHRNHDKERQIPANLNKVISVANCNFQFELMSGYGENLQHCYFGTKLFGINSSSSMEGPEKIIELKGTSFATPLVAFLSAIKFLTHPNISIDQFKSLHEKSLDSKQRIIKGSKKLKHQYMFSPEFFLHQ